MRSTSSGRVGRCGPAQGRGPEHPRRFRLRRPPGLSTEVRQKLGRHRPATIAQASRIDGITPAALLLSAGPAQGGARPEDRPDELPPPRSRSRMPDDFAHHFDVSRETIDNLVTYEALLRQLAKTIRSRRSRSTLDDIWSRHFADCAQLLALAPPDANPGSISAPVPDSQAWSSPYCSLGRDGARVHLVESDTRKAPSSGGRRDAPGRLWTSMRPGESRQCRNSI